MQSRAQRLVTLVTVIVSSVSLLSCERLQSGGDKYYRVSEAPTETFPQTGPYAGSLPNTVAAIGAADFRKFVRSRSWNGWARTRRCRGFLCALSLQTTEVSAEALDGAELVDPDSLTKSRFPIVMARLKNRGSHADARYGIPPTDEEWYLVWHADANGKPQARIYVLRDPKGAATLDSVGPDKLVIVCKHTHPEPRASKADADLTGCAERRVAYEPSPTQSSRAVSMTMLVSSYRTADAWISCSQGCCTSDAP